MIQITHVQTFRKKCENRKKYSGTLIAFLRNYNKEHIWSNFFFYKILSCLQLIDTQGIPLTVCTYCGSSHSWVLSESLMLHSYLACCLEPWSGWGWVWCWEARRGGRGDIVTRLRYCDSSLISRKVVQFTIIRTKLGCTLASACCRLPLPLVVSVREKRVNGNLGLKQTICNFVWNYYSPTCWI